MTEPSAYTPDLTHGQYLLLLRHVHAEDARLEGRHGTGDDERLTALKILIHDYSEYQAENERLRAENAEQLATLTELAPLSTATQRDEALAEVSRLAAVVTDYENRITWNTSCQQCATVLDRAIADHERADRAEVERDQARAIVRVLTRHVGAVTATALCDNKLGIDPLPEWVTAEGART